MYFVIKVLLFGLTNLKILILLMKIFLKTTSLANYLLERIDLNFNIFSLKKQQQNEATSI